MLELISLNTTKTIVHNLKIDEYDVNVISYFEDEILKRTKITNNLKTQKFAYKPETMNFYNFGGYDFSDFDYNKDYVDLNSKVVLIEPHLITKEFLDNCYCNWSVMDGFNYKLNKTYPLPRKKYYSLSLSSTNNFEKEVEVLLSNKRVSDLVVKETPYYNLDICGTQYAEFFVYEDEEIYKKLFKKKLDSFDKQRFVLKYLGVNFKNE